MTKDAAIYQALATSCAAIIAFIGVCHEFIGDTVFPWGPEFLGGPIGWHGLGIFTIAAGSLAVAGTLQRINVPITLFAILVATIGVTIALLTAVLHGQFHMFAVVGALAGVGAGVFHNRALATQSKSSGI
jgi:hypothetical protein